MRIAVDTNRYCDFLKADQKVVEWFREAERIVLPFVVLAELRAGFACGTAGSRNEGILQRFLNRPRVEVRYCPPCHTNPQGRRSPNDCDSSSSSS